MPQSKQPALAQMRVGLVVLAALAILILVIFAISGDITLPGFGKKLTIRTDMPSVDGLRKGAEVRLSGKKVGSVKEINFSTQIPTNDQQQNIVEIVMEIDGKIDGRPASDRIRSDSIAEMKTAGVLGDNVIDITPGTLNARAINNGDRINSKPARSFGDIANAANDAITRFRDISDDIAALTKGLRSGEGTAGKFLRDETLYIDLDRAIRQTETLLARVREGEGTVGKLINDPALYNQTSDVIAQLRRVADTVNAQLDAGKGTLGRLLKDEALYNKANDLIARLEQTSSRLDRTFEKVERGEGNLGKLINDEQLYTDTRAAVEKVNVITARLERGEGTAGLFLKDEKLYNNVNTFSVELTKLLYDFRQNPRKYLSVKVTIF